MKTLVIGLDKIIAPEYLLRPWTAEDAEVIERAGDLEANGQLQPISVWSDKEAGVFVRGDGGCRFTATELLAKEGRTIKGLNKNQIYVVVRGDKSDFKSDDDFNAAVMGEQIRSNAQATATSAKNYAEAIYKLNVHLKRTTAEISSAIGISEKQVYKWLKTLRLPANVFEMLQEGEITLANASAMAKVYGKLPVELQETLIAGKDRTATDFNELITEVTEELKSLNKANPKKKTEPVFIAKRQIKSKAILTSTLDNAIEKAESDPSPFNLGFLEALQFVFSVTPLEVADSETDWNTKQENKKKKEKESDITKLEKMQADIAKKIEVAKANKAEEVTEA